ncbi:FKBP-type peptidyl-prolyl cis-trans isomerase [Phenylobacterium sp.]|uniref:FKBP-type peptidyl-prolyl cis-trans isomerase n=1 Tax=Phenylobacterium sp. TaxID=1871053 RepID=UPI00356534BE
MSRPQGAARRLVMAGLAIAAGLGLARAASAQTVSLPGIRYQVMASGPPAGPHPTRADSVAMRYVGKLESGEVFSTSPGDGKETATFAVNAVIPGMSAALQLMRPGDRWRITMPPYLAYGPGRPLATAQPASSQAIQKRGIPPDATLIFDVELAAILSPKAP